MTNSIVLYIWKILDVQLKLSLKISGPDGFTGKFSKAFNEVTPILQNYLQKILPNSFSEASITLIPRSDRDIIRPQMKKTLDKIVVNNIQQHIKYIKRISQPVEFIPRIHIYFNIQKSIAVIHYINKLNKKKHDHGDRGKKHVTKSHIYFLIIFNDFYFFHYSWFTVFGQFLLYSKVTQSYIYTFFFSHYPPSCSIISDQIQFPVSYTAARIY